MCQIKKYMTQSSSKSNLCELLNSSVHAIWCWFICKAMYVYICVMHIQSSWYGRTPLGPGKSPGDLRKFRPICLGCVLRKCIFPEGRSKELPRMGCMGGLGGLGFFLYIYIYICIYIYIFPSIYVFPISQLANSKCADLRTWPYIANLIVCLL